MGSRIVYALFRTSWPKDEDGREYYYRRLVGVFFTLELARKSHRRYDVIQRVKLYQED
jgi:hypothetical protein